MLICYLRIKHKHVCFTRNNCRTIHHVNNWLKVKVEKAADIVSVGHRHIGKLLDCTFPLFHWTSIKEREIERRITT